MQHGHGFPDPDNAERWGPHGTAAATFAARLSFENVSLSYGQVAAVRDVSFELSQGEIVCLLGPSGCGKTTLLRLAAGVLRPQSGRILLDAREIAGPSCFVPPEKRNVGLMFQDYALFPHLSVLDNVAFGLARMKRREAREEARHALRRVGLAALQDSYPHVLSGGEQQRAALARAIVPRPAVMLMDEPFSGLDQRLRDTVRHETLALLKETRASSVLVTHDPVEAMGMADRILLMREGRLVQAGSPDMLYLHPQDPETARFFCDFNEFTGVVRSGEVATPLGRVPAGDIREGSAVLAMVRPHGIRQAGSEEPDGREARIVSARFLGETCEVGLRLPDLERVLIARPKLRAMPRVGDLIRVAVDHDHVLVFASASHDPI